MPVRKFGSVEEMAPLPDRRPFDPENLRLAIAWSHAAIALHSVRKTPGVHKYRSYEDMKAHGQPPTEPAPVTARSR
jgi:hypothetical protein